MKTIPFDIKLRNKIQSEENNYKGRYKVQTREGEPVRIICWDKKNTTFPIVALAEDSSHSYENLRSFRNNGKYCPTDLESSTDLCLVDTWEPKFKIGDRIKAIKQIPSLKDEKLIIKEIHNNRYCFSDDSWIYISDQDYWELVPEEKHTDFEKELANCLYKSIGVVCMDGMETLAKEFAPRLLELANKEIIEKLKEK